MCVLFKEKTKLITLGLLLNNDASLLYLRIYLEDGAGLEPALQPLTPSLASLSLRPSSFSVQELESLKLSSQSTSKYNTKYQYRTTVFFKKTKIFWIVGANLSTVFFNYLPIVEILVKPWKKKLIKRLSYTRKNR